MVNVTEAMESKYLTAEAVENSPSKQCVILTEGEYIEGQYGKRLTLKVNLDKKEKIWQPNKETVKSLSDVYTTESDNWVGKKVFLGIKELNNKILVIGTPDPQEMPKVTEEKIE